MPKNFSFNGFIDNEEIEVENKKKTENKDNSFSNFLEGIMSTMLPPDMLKMIEAEIAESGLAKNEYYEKASNELANSDPEMTAFLKGIFGEMISEDEDEDDAEMKPFHFELGNIDYYFSRMGSIPCRVSPTLYDEFLEKYGKGPYTSDDFSKLEIQTEFSEDIDAEICNSKTIHYAYHNNKFIMFYVEPEVSTTYGFYIAIFKDEFNNFKMTIPVFGNSIITDENLDELEFFDSRDNFKLPNGDYIFDEKGALTILDITKLIAGLNLMLVPVRSVILAPSKFGKISKQVSSTRESSKFIPIGTIKSSENTEARLFKKDFGLSDDKLEFNISLRTNELLQPSTIRFINSKLPENFDDVLQSMYSELRYNESTLYIDLDLASEEDIFRWRSEVGNSELL